MVEGSESQLQDGLRVAAFLDRVIRSNLSLGRPARVSCSLAPSGASGEMGLWLSLLGYLVVSLAAEQECDVYVTDASGVGPEYTIKVTLGGLVIALAPIDLDAIQRLWLVAQHQGLDLLETYGSFDGDPFRPGSDLAIMVFAKTRP